MPEPWGYGVVLFERQHAVFPLKYAQMVIPMSLLTEFNQHARARCATMNIEYTHAFAVEHAIELLATKLRPAIDGMALDATAIGCAIGIVSRFANYRFWLARCPLDGKPVIERLPGQTVDQAGYHSKQMIAHYKQMIKHNISVYLTDDLTFVF